CGCPHAQAAYPTAARATPLLSYLALLRMEVTAFHVRLAAYSSLWPYSSPHGVRLLAVILLCGARTFLPSCIISGDCLVSFKSHSITPTSSSTLHRHAKAQAHPDPMANF